MCIVFSFSVLFVLAVKPITSSLKWVVIVMMSIGFYEYVNVGTMSRARGRRKRKRTVPRASDPRTRNSKKPPVGCEELWGSIKNRGS